MMKTDDYNDLSVTKDKIRDGNVTTEKLADGAVNTDKLSDGVITTPKIANQNVTTEKMADAAIVTSKIADQNVTTEKIEEKAITNPKLGDQSVDGRVVREASLESKHLANESVTTDKVARKSITKDKIAEGAVDETLVKDGSIVNSKLSVDAVATSNIKNGSVTNDKLASGTLKIDKFDPELRKAIESATGLPDNLVGMIQDVDENLAKLNDTVYPITLNFTINPNVGTMQTEVRYSVSSDNKPLVPDTSIVSKQINDNAPKNLSETPSSGGTISTLIEGAREIFKFAVTKKGRTGKSTSATRYLCYYGSSPVKDMTAEVMNTLSKVSSTGVSFNPQINTNNGDYIWLIIPNFLTINRVTSAGFDVSLAAVQTVTNSLGTFKAYRTANALTTENWNLIIS